MSFSYEFLLALTVTANKWTLPGLKSDVYNPRLKFLLHEYVGEFSNFLFPQILLGTQKMGRLEFYVLLWVALPYQDLQRD
jgi:hypothetical protein